MVSPIPRPRLPASTIPPAAAVPPRSKAMPAGSFPRTHRRAVNAFPVRQGMGSRMRRPGACTARYDAPGAMPAGSFPRTP